METSQKRRLKIEFNFDALLYLGKGHNLSHILKQAEDFFYYYYLSLQ